VQGFALDDRQPFQRIQQFILKPESSAQILILGQAVDIGPVVKGLSIVSPETIHQLSMRDAEEPAPESSGIFQSSQPLQHLEPDVLSQILGGLGITADPPQVVVQGLGVLLDQCLEGLSFAKLAANDQQLKLIVLGVGAFRHIRVSCRIQWGSRGRSSEGSSRFKSVDASQWMQISVNQHGFRMPGLVLVHEDQPDRLCIILSLAISGVTELVSEADSLIKQLMHRRVPQIVGAYIATLWLAVEIGGWVTEQMGLPSAYALYLFVVLVAFLPSVVILAWRHGAPGPDNWGRLEKFTVPANVVLAAGLLVLIVQVRPPLAEPSSVRMESAVIERTLIDETGQEQVFQVAREGFGVSFVSLFWPSEDRSTDSVEWESYAAPWLLGVDLNQDPLITGGVIYAREPIERLLAAGFSDGIGEPMSMGLGIAEDQGADYLIRGSYQRTAEGYSLRADLYAVQDGALLDSFIQSGADLLSAVDGLSERIGQRLVGDLDRGEAEFRPLGLAELTTTDPAVLKPFVRGLNALMFDSDFDAGIVQLSEAAELDPSFSHAWAWLQQSYRQSGDMAAANSAIEQALAHDYKLETEMRFVLRANQYAVLGDLDRAIRVIRMWTEVTPLSLRAWMTLTRNLLIVGEIDEARAANLKAQEIDPDRASLKQTQAEIEELAGNFELASEILRNYLEAQPQDDEAWVSLGGTLERSGAIQAALEAYERASFVATDDFEAQLRLMRLEARAGNAEAAVRDLRRALSRPVQPTQQARLARELVNVLSNLGRIEELLIVINENREAIEQTLPPLARSLTVEGLRIAAMTRLGQFDLALQTIDEAQAQIPEQFQPFFAVAKLPIFEKQNEPLAANEEFEIFEAFVVNYEMPGQDIQLEAERARLMAIRGDYPAALELIDDAWQMMQGTFFFLLDDMTEPLRMQEARYQFESEQYEKALESVDDFLLVYPNQVDSQLLRAKALKALGRDDDAQAQLANVLELWSSADAGFRPLLEAQQLAEDWGF